VPLPASLIDQSTEPLVEEIDSRWTMAYAAGIADASSTYFDTRSSAGVVAHPLFAVCLEWPAVLEARRLASSEVLPRDELLRGVHATHDLTVHRLVEPGDRLSTTATVIGVEPRGPGAYEVLRLETETVSGEPVATTYMGSLFLGVGIDGPPSPAQLPSSPPIEDFESFVAVERHVPSNAGHVYTECARIFNPIHTDAAAAEAAGLPGIILHGTATLAMAITEVVKVHGADPALVRRVQCRFAAMVEIPSRVRVVIGSAEVDPDDPSKRLVRFEVANAHGEPAVRNGLVVLGVRRR
jgi:acyl dehydratase